MTADLKTQLDQAIKGFRPEVFNTKQSSIVQRLEKVHKLRKRVAEHEKKRKQLSRVIERKTIDEQDLERLEKALIWEIEEEKKAGHTSLSTESTPLSPTS